VAGYIIRSSALQAAFVFILAFNAWGYSQDECLKCHGSGGSSKLLIDMGQYMSSVHAKEEIQCSDCHTAITGDEHFAAKGFGKVDCGSCHPEQTKAPGVLSKLMSFHVVSHPKQDPAMAADRTMCIGCHQGQAAHGEKVPVTNQNCYKCHSPLDEKSVLFGYIHYADWRNRPVGITALCISLAGIVGAILLIAGCFINPIGKHRARK
jgi:hypothetical protein